MRRSGVGSGGGYGMNKVVVKPQPKLEPKPHKISLTGVSRIGNLVGTHVTGKGHRGELENRTPSLQQGHGYKTPVGPTDNLVSGPGGGRAVHRTGSQAQHGPVAGHVRSPARGI